MSSNTFQLDLLATRTKQEVPTGFRLARVIHKGKDKASQACFVPDVSEAKVQAFMAIPAGMIYLQEMIQELENKAIRIVADSGRSPCEDDLKLECLAAIASAVSVSIRLSGESITKWFNESGALRLQNAFVARGVEIEQAKAVASNYLPLFVKLAEKGKIAFENETVLGKFRKACEILFAESEEVFELKMLEKLENCFVPTAGNLGIDL